MGDNERRPASHRAPATTKDIDSIARARREVQEMRSMRRWHFYWKRRYPEQFADPMGPHAPQPQPTMPPAGSDEGGRHELLLGLRLRRLPL